MSIKFSSIEPAIDPSNRMTFLLDWELTMKCNLDCSYCPSGPYGGHDNTTRHPSKEDCFKTIDFMFQYVDIYMSTKPKFAKHVVLNVYGGESLHHPEIVDILIEVKKRYNELYKSKWNLLISTTTNAIISEKKLEKIIQNIDEFTVSYHAENTIKQKELFRRNILLIKKSNRSVKCVVILHNQDDLFADAEQQIEWCKENSIKVLPRQIDSMMGLQKFNQPVKRIAWFENLYKERSKTDIKVYDFQINDNNEVKLSDSGRSCCGGRQLCTDNDFRQRHAFVSNQFPEWYCSVDEFFVYIKQITGEVFTNKDCKMNFDGSVGPIGSLKDTESLLGKISKRITDRWSAPVQCKKTRCFCGLCAPKSLRREDFENLMKKYRLANIQ
jgi:MoaA/NifB/PqqE/SkfB family radical SAM enzyme